ncbi:hypothetical protein M426DRAFT_324747 [Hypoxylon sp. CI-4A]|nr:hypothetical protein M426DRAFT_324747 [Hypoxylon sp. CI-4A]
MKESWWRCSSYVGFMMSTVLAPGAVASHDHGYQIHQLEKNHDLVRHPKREASCQEIGYSLCPASANGGCCPENYACAASSCYVTTAGPTTACGTSGYYYCPMSANPGYCCPIGAVCNRTGCVPPVGVTSTSQSCPVSEFACTASPFGCCPHGMRCGAGTCYATTPETFFTSSTVTSTNSDGDTVTAVVTSTIVTTPGPASASATEAAGLTALIASTVSKLPSIETDSSSSDNGRGGLTGAQIGGIVGGVIALFAIVVAIAGVIIWHLRRTEKAAKEAQAAIASKHETSSGNPPSQKSGFGQSITEVDGEIDSVARASRNAHYRAHSDNSSTIGGYRSRSATPNQWGSNAPSTPPTWPGYMAQPPPSETPEARQASFDSYGVRQENSSSAPPRPSVDSQGSHPHSHNYAHSRQHSNSNASELDGGGGGVSELPDTPDPNDEASRRRSGSITQTPKAQVRRSSDPSGSSRGSPAPIGMPLGPLPEIGELHGHYGPPDLAAGQTAARLHHKDSSISSSPGGS